MNDILRRLRRVGPLIRAKKAIVERESLILAQLQKLKNDVASELAQRQGEYLEGVRQLNDLRTTSDRQGQHIYENSVSFIREKWIALYRKVQQVDKQIDAQYQLLVKAQGQLKSAEKLEEKYHLAWREHLSYKEQEQIDESSLNAFNRKRIIG